MRFEGPDGVGKEMAAMAFAQALVCTSGDPFGCGACSACKRAVTMGEGTPAVPLHPDVIFVQRGLYPPEVLGRSRPELQEISVDQVRTVVLERFAYPPHEGRARVFIIRQAEELSTSAANALLKMLEEPGRNTHFILLVSRPARLLSTILSRTLRVRFAPLPDDVLVDLTVKHGVDPALAERIVPLSAGSVDAALQLADPDASQERDTFVSKAMEALGAKDSTDSLGFADERTKDKRELRGHLEALATHFAFVARDAALRGDPEAPTLVTRYEIVLGALYHLERNASTALLIENMMLRLRAETG